MQTLNLHKLNERFVNNCLAMLAELDDDAEPGSKACWCVEGVTCTACRMRKDVLAARPDAFDHIERCTVCNSRNDIEMVHGELFCSRHAPNEEPDTAMERWDEQRKLTHAQL